MELAKFKSLQLAVLSSQRAYSTNRLRQTPNAKELA